MTRPAVFLDRDGTINEEVGYVNHVSRFLLLLCAPEAVRLLNASGLKVVVVTNQSGVARGYFPESLVTEITKLMCRELTARQAHIDGFYYCPHHPDGVVEPYNVACECRKPKPGMLRKAAAELDIDLKRSYMVGDRLNDVVFGQRAGLKGVITLTGYGRGEVEYLMRASGVEPDFIAEDLLDAARWIIADLENSRTCAS